MFKYCFDKCLEGSIYFFAGRNFLNRKLRMACWSIAFVCCVVCLSVPVLLLTLQQQYSPNFTHGWRPARGRPH